MTIRYKRDLNGVNWDAMREVLIANNFDNGRSPAQYARSFANSAVTCIVYDGDQIVGTARALSDGISNAYVVDVWTLSTYRRQGIAARMMAELTDDLPGQHVFLFTDEALNFYMNLGFRRQGIGLSKVIGRWLDNQPLASQNDDSQED